MPIRRLTPQDAIAFKDLRLAGLRAEPSSFGASYETEKGQPLTQVEQRLTLMPDRAVFGAFDGDALVGVVGLAREAGAKFAHKAFVWGMYVTPACRGQGLSRLLMNEAIALARTLPGIRQVKLCCNAGNAAAVGLYTSMGFEVYGREVGAMQIGDTLHDEVQMCLYFNHGATSA